MARGLPRRLAGRGAAIGADPMLTLTPRASELLVAATVAQGQAVVLIVPGDWNLKAVLAPVLDLLRARDCPPMTHAPLGLVICPSSGGRIVCRSVATSGPETMRGYQVAVVWTPGELPSEWEAAVPGLLRPDGQRVS